MKNPLALPLVLVAVVLGASGCSGSPEYSPQPEISITNEAINSTIANQKWDASYALQSVLRAIHEETGSTASVLDDLDYESLTEKYPRAMSGIEPSVGREATESFIREYSKHLSVAPQGLHVGVKQADLESPVDKSLKITGTDLFMSYWEESRVVTHEGVSVTTRDTLDDVFTMTQVNGTWKITGISL